MSKYLIEETGTYKNYNYKCILMPMGHRCGYVEIPKGHELHGKHYDDINIDCHGGLTFSDFLEDAYLIGFDCAHCDDESDIDAAYAKGLIDSHTYEFNKKLQSEFFMEGTTIKTQDFVVKECKHIIDQIVVREQVKEIGCNEH